jgi:hypothetical protein
MNGKVVTPAVEATTVGVSLREYFDAKIEARDKYVDSMFKNQETAVTAALASADKANLKAEIASEKRFDSVNEFRQSLADAGRLNMPRTEAELRFNGIESTLKSLQDDTLAHTERNRGESRVWAIVTGVMGGVLGAIGGYLSGHPFR